MLGIDAVRDTLQNAVGKNVVEISLEGNPSKSARMHNDEKLTIVFSDGSQLVLLIGSNGQNLMNDVRGLKASDLSLSFVAHFRP